MAKIFIRASVECPNEIFTRLSLMQTCDTVMKSKSESFYFVKQVDRG